MQHEEIEKGIAFLEEGKIIEALDSTVGWGRRDTSAHKENPSATFYYHIEDALVSSALALLTDRTKARLNTAFSHPVHFQEGVSKLHAVVYYFLQKECTIIERGGRYIITKTGGESWSFGIVRLTEHMRELYYALQTVSRTFKPDAALLKKGRVELCRSLCVPA